MGMTENAAPLQTVDRALRVLLAFDANHPQWRAADLARHLGWDKSVTHRLLGTLVHRGFLLVDPDSRCYRLGTAIYELGQLAARDNPMLALVRPRLREVARRTKETALFTVPDGDEAHCLAAVEGPTQIRYSTQVGGRIPGHTGAGAKVLFAWRTEREQRALFGKRTLARFTEETTTDLDELLADFAQIRSTGVSVSRGELDADVGAVSVPVRSGDEVVGALSSVGPLPRVLREQDQLVEVLTEFAASLTRQLSAPPDDAPSTDTP